MNVTANEVKALQGIHDSDYGDHILDDVWSWSANTFNPQSSFPGVVSSLVKKGLVVATGEGKDACIRFTPEGVKALKAAGGRVTRFGANEF